MRFYNLSAETARKLCKAHGFTYPMEPGERNVFASGATLFRDSAGRYGIASSTLKGEDLPPGCKIGPVEKGGKCSITLAKNPRKKAKEKAMEGTPKKTRRKAAA